MSDTGLDHYVQDSYRCRLFWGRGGAQRAARIGGILVIVDVLSFSTAVSTAVAGGGIIIPCANDSEAARIAESTGAVAATHRREVRAGKGFSLSPLTFVDIEPGTTVALGSPNGAVCSLYGGAAEHLVVGALVNAAAVARVVFGLLSRSGASVSIIACGERWMEPIEGEGMRVAVEDYLGAGAIISGLDVEKSPEALVCQGAFLQLRDQLSRIISDCGSGRELRAKGFAGDVEHSARLDRYDAVPIMRDDRLLAFDPSEVL